MNISFQVYASNGLKVTLSASVDNMHQANTFAQDALRAGFSAEPPAERKEETIVTVVRRKHVDDNERVTPVIDMYPAWKGEYGQFRFIGIYLNTEEDVAQFEAYSGLVLDQIPLYQSDVPLKRKVGRVSEVETKCRPFTAYKREDGLKEINGVEQMTWKFAGYGVFTPAQPAAVVTTPALPTGTILPPAGSIAGAPMRPASSPSHQDPRNPLRSAAR